MNVAYLSRTEDDGWRLAGCGERCRIVRVTFPGRRWTERLPIHDPHHHEAYAEAVRRAIVQTGPLTIDLTTRRVTIREREITLTAHEWAVLAELAGRPETVIAHAALLRHVWGEEWVASVQILRITISRLRARLGEAGSLIRNAPGRGYCLEIIPVGATPEPRRWARDWDACRSCHRVDRVHDSHGQCVNCRSLEHWRDGAKATNRGAHDGSTEP